MRSAFLGVLTLAITAGLAAAQTRAASPALDIPRAAAEPRIDGNLDDPAWRTAARLIDFSQMEPVDGAPATEMTDVWITHDGRRLYLAFHARYSDPALIRANRSDRDKIDRDDRISVYLDTFRDQQRAFMFAVNGYGVQADAIRNAAAGGPTCPVTDRKGRKGEAGRLL